MPLPFTILDTTTTQAPNSTSDGNRGTAVGSDGWERNVVLWVALGGSLLCLASAILSYVFLVWLPRRGYERLEHRRQDLEEVTRLLEEARGRPRKVSPNESLTESERHFLIHDFRDFL